jgi:hypothetical protein
MDSDKISVMKDGVAAEFASPEDLLSDGRSLTLFGVREQIKLNRCCFRFRGETVRYADRKLTVPFVDS